MSLISLFSLFNAAFLVFILALDYSFVSVTSSVSPVLTFGTYIFLQPAVHVTLTETSTTAISQDLSISVLKMHEE